MSAPLVLRPYQQAAVQALRSSFGQGNRRVMLYLPTGGGKTICAEAIIRGVIEKGGRVAFIMNRKQLVRQASEHLSQKAMPSIPHGILQAENTHSISAPVLVCSIDTLVARIRSGKDTGLDGVRLFVIDEAHGVAGSMKYRELLFRYNRVPVIGLSATPFSAGLGKHYEEVSGPLFQHLVVGSTIKELIDLGNLCDIDIFAPAEPDLTGVKTARGIGGEVDFVEADLARAMDKPSLVGNIVGHWRQLAAGKQTVVFATNIPHSQHIVAEFQRAGVKAEHIDYHADDDQRKDVLDRFAAGEFTVLSNSALLAEGWDCPATEVMILARPTKSLIRYIQMVGRVLRPAPGKSRALLLDHSGSALKLGFPTDDLPLELDDGKANASSNRKQERKVSEPKACPACKFVRPAGVHQCPKCGFAPARQSDVEVRDGELRKLDRKGKKPATPDRKQHVYSQLLQVARNKGYSPGWVAHKYRAMFEVWPRGMRDVPATPTAELLSWLRSQQIRFAKGQERAQQEGRTNG